MPAPPDRLTALGTAVKRWRFAWRMGDQNRWPILRRVRFALGRRVRW